MTLAALDRYDPRAQDAGMDFRAYRLLPNRPLEVVVECADGSRALVRGVLRSVPDTHSGGVAMRIVVADAVAEPLKD